MYQTKYSRFAPTGMFSSFPDCIVGRLEMGVPQSDQNWTRRESQKVKKRVWHLLVKNHLADRHLVDSMLNVWSRVCHQTLTTKCLLVKCFSTKKTWNSLKRTTQHIDYSPNNSLSINSIGNDKLLDTVPGHLVNMTFYLMTKSCFSRRKA